MIVRIFSGVFRPRIENKTNDNNDVKYSKQQYNKTVANKIDGNDNSAKINETKTATTTNININKCDHKNNHAIHERWNRRQQLPQ